MGTAIISPPEIIELLEGVAEGTTTDEDEIRRIAGACYWLKQDVPGIGAALERFDHLRWLSIGTTPHQFLPNVARVLADTIRQLTHPPE